MDKAGPLLLSHFYWDYFLGFLDNRLLFFRSACHYSRKVAILTVAVVI